MRLLNISTGKIEFYKLPTDAPPYAAISYVWPKDPNHKWSKISNVIAPFTPKPGSSASRTLTTLPFESKWPIPSCSPETLNRALTAIYQDGSQVLDGIKAQDAVSPPAFTHLWMDVLCLNQIDDKDKAEDVKHMKDYYSNAVCVWVFLNNLGEPDVPITKSGPARWFTRLWTLQECILPERLYFYLAVSDTGKADDPLSGRWVSRKHLMAYIGVCVGIASTNILEPTNEAEAFKWGMQIMALSVTKKPSIKTALLFSTVRECRFDADRLYGILGMLPEDKSLFDVDKLIMDYSKGFDVISESFARALGPSLLNSFAFMCPPPDELREVDRNLKISSRLGWFGNFEPGFFISGSLSNWCDRDQLSRWMTDNSFDVSHEVQWDPLNRPKEFKVDLPIAATWHEPGLPEAGPQGINGVMLKAAPVTRIKSMADLGANKVFRDFCDPSDFNRNKDNKSVLLKEYMKSLIGSIMVFIKADQAFLGWAAGERKQFLSHFGRNLNMSKDQEEEYKKQFGEFTGAIADKLAQETPKAADSTQASPKAGWFSKAKESLNKVKDTISIGVSRMGQVIAMVDAIFLYPPYMRELNIVTEDGNKLAGNGSYLDVAKYPNEKYVIILVARSTTSAKMYTFLDQCDTHILGKVLREGDAAKGQPLVVRKVGVVHVGDYFAKFTSAETGSAVAASVGGITQMADFTMMDVVAV